MADVVIMEGWKELETKLLGLSTQIAKGALKQGVAAGAKFMKAEVKAKAPLLSGFTWGQHQPPGTLKRAIMTVFCPELSNDYQATYKVTVKKGKKYRNRGKKGNLSQDAFYADWVERGHFYVPPKTNDRTSWNAHRKQAKSKSDAVFIAAHPFMRPAWDTKKDQALEAIRKELEIKIEQVASK